jgi:hypothetical protein
MWVTRGDSEGRKPHAISRALPCQNSDSAFTYCKFIFYNFSFEFTINLNSVDTQKNDIVKNEIFSSIESLENSTSIYCSQYRSWIVKGVICIMFPIFSR